MSEKLPVVFLAPGWIWTKRVLKRLSPETWLLLGWDLLGCSCLSPFRLRPDNSHKTTGVSKCCGFQGREVPKLGIVTNRADTTPGFLIQPVSDGAWELVSLTSSRCCWHLWSFWQPHLEKPWAKALSINVWTYNKGIIWNFSRNAKSKTSPRPDLMILNLHHNETPDNAYTFSLHWWE